MYCRNYCGGQMWSMTKVLTSKTYFGLATDFAGLMPPKSLAITTNSSSISNTGCSSGPEKVLGSE